MTTPYINSHNELKNVKRNKNGLISPSFRGLCYESNRSTVNCILIKMRRATAPLILLLILVAGCEIEKDPVEEPLDPSLLLTDGFCLVKDGHVVLNHYDIDYYDFSAHMIYLKDPGSFEEKFQVMGPATVYADSTRIYDLSLVSLAASYIPQGPVIWFPFWYPADFVVPIDRMWIYKEDPWLFGDPREDTRIVEVLKKYDQFRHGLQCNILSFWYNAEDGVILELELWNDDPMNYYYYDPDKLGLEHYHYVTNGLFLKNNDTGESYTHHTRGLSWEDADPDRMSLLESDSSVILTIAYAEFDVLSPGNYTAHFEFPGPNRVENREDLDQENGRIWLGDIDLYSEVVVE